MLSWLLQTIRIEWYLFGFKSVLEILLISAALYYWLRLLVQDRQKPLAQWFLGYLVGASLIFYLHLPVASNVVLSTAPAVLLFFMLIHQETLQKNSIALHNISPAQPNARDWLADIVRLCMVSMNDKKNSALVIEKTDALGTLLESPLILNAPITPALINILYGSTAYETDLFWWLNRHGKLLGINTRAKDTQNDLLADMLLISSKTDALFILVDAHMQLFTLIAHAKMIETGQATELLNAARAYLAVPSLASQKKEHWYDPSAHLGQQSEQQA